MSHSWSSALHWKCSIPQGIKGSNPFVSASLIYIYMNFLKILEIFNNNQGIIAFIGLLISIFTMFITIKNMYLM